MFGARRTIMRVTCAAFAVALALPAAGCGAQRPYWMTHPVPSAVDFPAPSVATTVPLSAEVTAAVWAAVLRQRGAGMLGNREFYAKPVSKPAGSVFDSLTPTGRWSAGWLNGGDHTPLQMYVAPAPGGKVWGYTDYPTISRGADDALARVLHGRQATARYVYRGRLSWWVVRLADGTEGAVAVDYYNRAWVDGAPLEERLYPADIIFSEVRM